MLMDNAVPDPTCMLVQPAAYRGVLMVSSAGQEGPAIGTTLVFEPLCCVGFSGKVTDCLAWEGDVWE